MASYIKDVAEWISKSRDEYEQDFLLDQTDREEAEADNSFAFSTDASMSQWNSEALKQRTDTKRPVLQSNRMPIYMRHVTNAGRQNKPEIKVSPGDDGTEETAEMYEARIRQLIYECKGDIARDTARDQQVASGRAFIRVTTRWIGKKEVPWVERIENQFSVIPGPHREYDCSDADRMWVVTMITKEKHRRDYGEESVLNSTNFAPFQNSERWVNVGKNNDMIQIAEKFEKHYGAEDPKTGQREWVVCRYVFNGTEILEEEEALTDDIGIVPQWGFECVVDGIKRHISLINPAKSDQRLVNLYVSNIAENIAKQPKDRYRAPFGSIASQHEDAYAGNDPKAVLWYRQYDENGRELHIPEMISYDPPIQALSEGLQQAIEGIKATMGIFDASIGQRSNETSGVAINRRKVEGEVINYHFPDNEARSWDRVGQILIKMIDALDAGKESVPVRYENGKTEMVPLDRPYKHPRTGNEVTHKLDANAYVLHVEQGPSYQNAVEQKQEAEGAIIQAAPELMLTELGVNWIRNSGRPGADEDAEALTRYINFIKPGLIPDKNAPQIPPAVAQQMQQMQQKNETLQAFSQKLHEEIQTKQVEQQGKLALQQQSDAVKLEIAKMQEETKRVLGLAQIASEEARLKLEQELNIVHKKFDAAKDLTMQANEHQHSTMTQAADQAHASDQQAQTQDFQAQQSDAEREAAAEQAEQQGGQE